MLDNGGQNDGGELLLGEDLRSAVIGKSVTFTNGRAVTGYECYIFKLDGNTLACGREGILDYGRTIISEDRVCAGNEQSICWQFYRTSDNRYFIRHLAFEPSFPEEYVCIEEWPGRISACRGPHNE